MHLDIEEGLKIFPDKGVLCWDSALDGWMTKAWDCTYTLAKVRQDFFIGHCLREMWEI